MKRVLRLRVWSLILSVCVSFSYPYYELLV
jgi:hypothetical protein